MSRRTEIERRNGGREGGWGGWGGGGVAEGGDKLDF